MWQEKRFLSEISMAIKTRSPSSLPFNLSEMQQRSFCRGALLPYLLSFPLNPKVNRSLSRELLKGSKIWWAWLGLVFLVWFGFLLVFFFQICCMNLPAACPCSSSRSFPPVVL